ncbi:MAG: hypothetical protein LKH45_11170 [Acetobacter sp.]|jgi:hypothetical protein|nr:hypothetical protein [Acetobacter sp.]
MITGAAPLSDEKTAVPKSSSVISTNMAQEATAVSPDSATLQQKTVEPEASAKAGTIGLDNVSREAVDGTNRVRTGQVIIPADATADDLNSLSAQKSAQANRAALGAAAAYHEVPSATPVNNTIPTNDGLKG